ncbi:MAG: hypothetical protein ACRDI3_03055 [Actinomycetota bacterium]
MSVRRFFLVGIAVLAAVAVVALVAIFSSNRPDSDRGTRFATTEDLRERGVIEFPEYELFLVWNDGDPLVLSSDAQHIPNENVVWCESSEMFESPAHGEKFDSRGFYYGGPAQSGLARYPYAIIDGLIYSTLEHATEGPARGEGSPHEPEGRFCVAD